jgi:Cu/Ag efflux pump CusA
MISTVVGASIKFRALVAGAAVILLGIGVAQLRHADVERYGEFAPPEVQVQAEALGLSAAEVEQLITVPLEQDLLNGVPWLDQIRSESVPGLSTIDMVFQRGTDQLKARQMVAEHLSQAHALPQVGTPPVMVQPTASAGRVLMISLSAPDLSLIDLSILARWKIRPKLEGLPGVANVAIWGQRDRQLQVQVDPQKLQQYGVSLNQVVSSTGNALWVSPLTFVEASTPGTGGFVDTPSQRLAIQHVTPITTASSLAAVTIEDTGGRTLRLGQVAQVVEDHQPLIGDTVLDGPAGLMLVVQKFRGADTRQVTSAVEDALTEMQPGLSGISIDTRVYRPASYLNAALHNLAVRAGIGLLLMCLVLVGYFRSWRPVLITVGTLLLSLIAAGLILQLFGTSFNTLTLGGLTAALGVVIADAASNAQLFRQPLGPPAPEPAESADQLVDRIRAVRLPLVHATVIVALLPLPALALGGVAGALARSAVTSYLVAVAVALLVAHLVAPGLGTLLAGRTGRTHRPSPLATAAGRLFDRQAARLLRSSRLLLGWLAVLVIGTLSLLPQLSSRNSALPVLQDRDLTIHWQAAAGTSLPEMTRITDRVTADLHAVPGVRSIGSHVGRALLADQPVNVDSAEIWVSLRASADYGRTMTAIRDIVGRYPGIRAELSSYTADRLAAADTGSKAPLVVRVYGQDLQQLAAKAGDVRALLTGVRGVRHAGVAVGTVEPSVQVQVDLARAQRYGITPGDVRRASATFFAGLPVGSLYEDQKIFDVVVWGIPSSRRVPADVADLLLDTPSGGRVRLGEVADVRMDAQPTDIHHDNISRSLDVTADISGRSAASVVREVRDRLAALPMPSEFHAEVLNGSAPVQAEHRRLLLAGIGVALAILLVLQASLASWRLALLTLLSAPLGLTGAVVVAPLVGGVRTTPALLAMLGVLALVLRDCLQLATRYRDSAGPSGRLQPATVYAVTRARLDPIVLSALLCAVALLPLAAGGVVAGTELVQRLAVVAIAGLATAVPFTTLVYPALCTRFAAQVGAKPSPVGPPAAAAGPSAAGPSAAVPSAAERK